MTWLGMGSCQCPHPVTTHQRMYHTNNKLIREVICIPPSLHPSPLSDRHDMLLYLLRFIVREDAFVLRATTFELIERFALKYRFIAIDWFINIFQYSSRCRRRWPTQCSDASSLVRLYRTIRPGQGSEEREPIYSKVCTMLWGRIYTGTGPVVSERERERLFRLIVVQLPRIVRRD